MAVIIAARCAEIMPKYIRQLPEWPEFRWDHEILAAPCSEVLRTLTEDVMNSSKIEGEKLERDQVRSSIARRLGMLDRQGANRREDAISLTD